MQMSKCPNCNAPLVYRKDRQIYLCEYCKAEFRDETGKQGSPETPEKKVIYEYHHINVPEQAQSVKQAAEARKKNSGCLRVFLAAAGIFCALMGAAGFSTRYTAMGIVMIAIGIWLIIMASRKR